MCDTNFHNHHYHHYHRISPFKGIVHLAILNIIREKPVYGSEIYRILRDNYGLDIPAPLVYTLLRRMERRGLIISEWKTEETGPVKRIYRLTDEGLEYLRDSINRLRKIKEIIDNLLSKTEALSLDI